MNAERSTLVLTILLATQAFVLSKALEPAGGLHEALNHAGGNRSELESALRKAKVSVLNSSPRC